MEFEYIKTIKISDLIEKQGTVHKFENGSEVALFIVNGELFAFDNKCPHMGMPLCEGMILENKFLMCRYHQWKFDLKTGVSTFAPNIYLKKYETRIESGDIYVKMVKY